MSKEEYNDISAAFDRSMTRVANDDTLPKKAAIGAFGVLAGLQLFIKEYYEKHTTDTPKGLNEAFRSFMNSTEYPPANQDEERMALDALKAGAKWMAGQGETHEHYVIREIADHDIGPAIVCYPETFEIGDKVVVQIRKK